jgi:hypothetical protein
MMKKLSLTAWGEKVRREASQLAESANEYCVEMTEDPEDAQALRKDFARQIFELITATVRGESSESLKERIPREDGGLPLDPLTYSGMLLAYVLDRRHKTRNTLSTEETFLIGTVMGDVFGQAFIEGRRK